LKVSLAYHYPTKYGHDDDKDLFRGSFEDFWQPPLVVSFQNQKRT